jgi:Domain of unknown function (DUF4124)
MTIRIVAAAALCLLAAPTLLAQNKTVFRCEDLSGRVTYSDEACKGGVALKNDDARTEQERKQAEQVAKREERMADKLTRERRAAEKAHRAPGAAHITHSAAEKAANDAGAAKNKKAATNKSKKPAKDKDAALAKTQS